MALDFSYRVVNGADLTPPQSGYFLDVHPLDPASFGANALLNISWVGYPFGNYQQTTTVNDVYLTGDHDFSDPECADINVVTDDFFRHNYFYPGLYRVILTLVQQDTAVYEEGFGICIGGTVLDSCEKLIQVGPEMPPVETHPLSQLKWDFNGKIPFKDEFQVEADPTDPNQEHPDLAVYGFDPGPYLVELYWSYHDMVNGTDWVHEGIDITDDCRLKMSTVWWYNASMLGLGSHSGLPGYAILFDELSFEICGMPDRTKFTHGFWDNMFDPPYWTTDCVCGFMFLGGYAPLPFGPIGTYLGLFIEAGPDDDWRWKLEREGYTSGNKTDYLGTFDPVAHRWVKVTKSGYDMITVQVSPDRSDWTTLWSGSWGAGIPVGVVPNEWFPAGQLQFYAGLPWTGDPHYDPDTGFWIIDNINKNGGDGCGGPPEEPCPKDITKPEIRKVNVSCATGDVKVEASPYKSSIPQGNSEWILTELPSGKVLFDVIDKPGSKYTFKDLKPGNYTVAVCYINRCDKACSDPYEFCVPCPCGGGDLSDFSELRLGPLVTLEDHKKALVDFETKFNQLVKALRGS